MLISARLGQNGPEDSGVIVPACASFYVANKHTYNADHHPPPPPPPPPPTSPRRFVAGDELQRAANPWERIFNPPDRSRASGAGGRVRGLQSAEANFLKRPVSRGGTAYWAHRYIFYLFYFFPLALVTGGSFPIFSLLIPSSSNSYRFGGGASDGRRGGHSIRRCASARVYVRDFVR